MTCEIDQSTTDVETVEGHAICASCLRKTTRWNNSTACMTCGMVVANRWAACPGCDGTALLWYAAGLFSSVEPVEVAATDPTMATWSDFPPSDPPVSLDDPPVHPDPLPPVDPLPPDNS